MKTWTNFVVEYGVDGFRLDGPNGVAYQSDTLATWDAVARNAAAAGHRSATSAPGGAESNGECEDGPGRYELFGVVSHMGGNTACGHYVAHVKIEGQWHIFNDRKVAISQKPPLELGYLYFYRCSA